MSAPKKYTHEQRIKTIEVVLSKLYNQMKLIDQEVGKIVKELNKDEEE